LHNTSGAYIELRDDKGITVDSVNFMKKWPHITKQGESLHKLNNLTWEVNPLSPLNIPEPIIPVEPIEPIVYGGVRISELYPNPIEGGKEFVELENITDTDINLEGWKLDDLISGGSQPQNLTGIIPAKGFIVFEEDKDLKIILNNEIDEVNLIDPNGIIQDSIDYVMTNKQKGFSYMRIGENFVWSSTPSPNMLNIAPQDTEELSPPESPSLPIQPTPTSAPSPQYPIGSVILSELYPYPQSGQPEFIEIYNTTNQVIDLTGWTISDLAKSYPLSGVLYPGEYKLFDQSITKIALNNTSETITVTDNYQQIQSTTSYTKAKQGLGYIPILQNWGWTRTLTPGIANIFTENDTNNTIIYKNIQNFDELMNLEDGENLELTGQVIIPPSKLNDTSFYMYQNRMIRVYDRQKRFPQLQEGDMISLKGEWHNTDTQQYMKTSSEGDIQIIQNQQPIVLRSTTTQTLTPNDWGRIVQIGGNLDTNTSTKLGITNARYTGTIKLHPKSFAKPPMRKGDIVSVTGFTEIYDGEIRIIPWKSSQIKVIPATKVVKANSSDSKTPNISIDSIQQDSVSNNTVQISEFQDLDSFTLPFGANILDTIQDLPWYKYISQWIQKYPILSFAIILNIAWTLYRLIQKV
jgi:hypothetical protein